MYGRTNSKTFFIAAASGVLLNLTGFVAEARSALPASSPSSRLQDAAVSPAAGIVPAPADVSSKPLQAKVIDVVGQVRWRPSAAVAWKDARNAKVEDLLSAGAEVRTGMRSRATLKFDNATVLIDSNSNFALPTAELVKENDGDVYRTVAQMKSGRADFQVDKVGARNDFKVVTPSSTLAVRGTGFSVTTGAQSGTEVVGARTNAIAAIQLKYAATTHTVELSGGGGEAKSSSALPEPATSALIASIGQAPMAGTSTSAAEREVSATQGTTQTPVQAQATSTVAAVATIVEQVAEAESGESNGDGDGIGAIVADLVAVEGLVGASGEARAGSVAELRVAIEALDRAQAALINARIASVAFHAAESDAVNAAAAVAQLLAQVQGAGADIGALGEARGFRLSAIDNAKNAFDRFASGLGGTQSGSNIVQGGGGSGASTVREFADAAIADAGFSRGSANAAQDGSDGAEHFRGIAFDRLSTAILRQLDVLGAAETVDTNGSSVSTAAANARAYLAVVSEARAGIAQIFAGRPLPAIAHGLETVLGHLEIASQAVLEANANSDQAVALVAEARERAQVAVLEATQNAALSAAQDALAALNAANEADAAADDAQSGMAKLDLAIEAMLAAQDQESAALAAKIAAESFRQIAEFNQAEAQAQIDLHNGAAGIAHDARITAGTDLLAALGHLDDAILNSGLTTAQMEACLAALGQSIPNEDAANAAAIAARGFADLTGVNAGAARQSADDAAVAAGAAAAQVQVESAGDVLGGYLARLADIRAAIQSAADSASAAASAASGAGIAAGVAQTNGNEFAAQFGGQADGIDVAAAALHAVDRAIALATDASDYLQAASAAHTAAQGALAAVTAPNGAALDFSATTQSAIDAGNDAGFADSAAIEAARLAAVADAEAGTAEAAVGALGEAIAAKSARNSAQALASSAQSDGSAANSTLDQFDATSLHAVGQRDSAQGSAADAGIAEGAIGDVIVELDAQLATMLNALNSEDLAAATALRDALNASDLEQRASTAVTAANAAKASSRTAADAAAVDATSGHVLVGNASDFAGVASVASSDATVAANLSLSHANLAGGFSTASGNFAAAAITGLSTAAASVNQIASAAAAFADAANTASGEANGVASSAAGMVSALQVRLDATNPGAIDLAAQLAEIAALQAETSASAVQAAYTRGEGEAAASGEAVQTLFHKIETFQHAASVASARDAIVINASQVDAAISAHDAALAGALGEKTFASDARDQTMLHRNTAENESMLAISNFDNGVAFWQSGDTSSARGLLTLTVNNSGSAEVASQLAFGASLEVGQHATAANGFASTSSTQAQIASTNLSEASTSQAGMNTALGNAQQEASSAGSAAQLSQNGATQADTALAQSFADRALALSIAALERAQEALAARDQANGRLALASSAEQQAGFSETGFVATSVQGILTEANNFANSADAFADLAALHGNLANAAIGSFTAESDSIAFRLDADFALSNANFAHGLAASAVDNHNLALGNVTELFAAAGVSLQSTQAAHDQAISFSDATHTFYLTALGGTDVALNANSADSSATQSQQHSAQANGFAVETRGYADQALEQANISNQAAVDYANATGAADAAALAAGTAHAGASDAATQAAAFASAAQNFAALIATTSAASAESLAIAARNNAAIQRDGAFTSQQAAQASANSARSMGDFLVFTRTAEIAADTVARAVSAETLATAAIAAAAQARTDANAALALVPPPVN